MNDVIIKKHRVSFRLDDHEMLAFLERMRREGYKSRSKFIRNLLFSAPMKRRKLTVSDEKLPEILLQFQAEFKRIGVNYNQYVKSFNSILNVKNKYGKPVASAASAKYTAVSLMKETEKMIVLFKEITGVLNKTSKV